MPTLRSNQICLSQTPYYHCTSRCVRRAFLCGQDSQTGKTFLHRSIWLENRILCLSKIFAINICAYAIMANHIHLILHVDPTKSLNWGNREVIERWHKIFKGNVISQKFIKNAKVDKYLQQALDNLVSNYREKLTSVSLFMKCLTEPIARIANKEDNCTGKFWESRFHSQALLGEDALLACMVYVDLNPIRSGIATTPETSKFTSIKLRIDANKSSQKEAGLMPFIEAVGNDQRYINYKLEDYLSLVDTTGKIIRADKKANIDQKLEPILNRLNFNSKNWIELASSFELLFKGAVGPIGDVNKFYKSQGSKRVAGCVNCKHYFDADQPL